MTLTLSRLSKDNFEVRDTNGQILYWVENHHRHLMSANPILFYKLSPSGEKTKFGEIEFHQWSPNLLTLQGKQTELDNTFVPKGWPSKCVDMF